jgi:WD40 repeat protein
VGKLEGKKRTPVVFFAVAFLAILVVMFVANRQSSLMNEIRFPLNNGIANLSTFDNLLTAVSNDNKIYVWEWADVSKKPREGAVESDQAALVTSDTVVSVKGANPDCVVMSGLDANKSHREIPLPPRSDMAYLGVNQDRSKIVLLLTRSNNDSSGRVKYDLLDVLIGAGQVQPIVTIDSEQSKAGHLSVSDDGNHIVVVGEKNSHGWMFTVDAKKRRMEWQKEIPDLRKLYKAVFSSDGATIYARGSDSTLLLIKTSSGEIIDRLLPIEENKSTYRVQPIQMVVASHDGSLVAATVFGNIYVWDCKTHEKFSIGASGHKVISSMVFSPDSRFLATSDMRQGGKIRILRMPRH